MSRTSAQAPAAAPVLALPRTAAPAAIDFTQLQGLLFDIDGTLCNSDPLHFQAFQELLVAQGFNAGAPISEEFFRLHISGRHNPEIALDLFPDQSEEWRTAFYTKKEQRYRELAGGSLQRLPGLSRMMAWVEARGVRRVAVTNAPRANAQLMLDALGMQTWFEAVVLGEECTRPKPFPDPYLVGLQQLGLQGQGHRALVLEDSPAGVQAAVAAGIPVLGLTTGQSAETLVEAGAVAVVSDFNGVMDLIEAAQGPHAAR